MNKLIRHAMATTIPALGAKAWKRTAPVRERAVDAVKSIPGHVKDIVREKREAGK